MMISSSRWFTIAKWLTQAIILFAIAVVTAVDTEDWDGKQLAAFSNDVLKSINDLRAQLKTNPLKLDPDASDKGLNGLARMYATKWGSTSSTGPLPLEPDQPWIESVGTKSGKKFAELEKLYRGALLYFDRSKNHITGNALVKLAETRAIAKPGEADFANVGDTATAISYTCNTLRKLLWEPAEMIGVAAAWNKERGKQSYAILFDNAHVPNGQKSSLVGKLSKEAMAYLGKLKCLHLATDEMFNAPVHDEMMKEAFEDVAKAKGAWTTDQLIRFRKDVLLGINALREQFGGKALQLDDDLTKAAGFFVDNWAKASLIVPDAKADIPWVVSTIKETKIKSLEAVKTLRDSAVLFQHNGNTHLKPGFFVRLLKDVDPSSPLLGSIPHVFCNEGADTIDRDGKLQVYCHRLKQLLWVPSEKVGIGVIFHGSQVGMRYALFFDPARKRFEKETKAKFTPAAKAFIEAKGNECRMDFLGDHAERFHTDVIKEIKDLRTAFGAAFKESKPLEGKPAEKPEDKKPRPFAETPELMKQAKEYADAWAISEGPINVPTAKGFLLYAKRRISKTSDNLENTKPHVDASGVIESFDVETKPKEFIKNVLDADRFGLPLPVTKQSTGPVSLTAAAPTGIRLSQLLCPEATEFGFAVTTYVYNADPVIPNVSHYFVLLFNAQCNSLPKITDQNAIDKLLANGWVRGKGDMWWFMGDINKLRLLEENKIKL